MEKKAFTYTYSAKDQAEIENIRKKYEPQSRYESNLDQLRKLDASVTSKATMISLIVGIAGTLVLGFGLSLILSDLYALISLSKSLCQILGIVIGVIGIFIDSINYPLYDIIIMRERKRVAPEIIRLSNELMK